MAARFVVVAAFLAACATYYHPPYGFTAFIQFSSVAHDRELPAVREVPHYETHDGYDGMYYAQLAVDPLLRDPAIDQALDSPPFRARLAWVALPAPRAGGSKGEPSGAAARRRLEVWAGQAVEFVTVGRDPDGVPLVEILWRPTGESVVTLNYEMVRSGFARADCAMSGEFALPCRVLRKAEDVARQERRGLWAARP